MPKRTNSPELINYPHPKDPDWWKQRIHYIYKSKAGRPKLLLANIDEIDVKITRLREIIKIEQVIPRKKGKSQESSSKRGKGKGTHQAHKRRGRVFHVMSDWKVVGYTVDDSGHIDGVIAQDANGGLHYITT